MHSQRAGVGENLAVCSILNGPPRAQPKNFNLNLSILRRISSVKVEEYDCIPFEAGYPANQGGTTSKVTLVLDILMSMDGCFCFINLKRGKSYVRDHKKQTRIKSFNHRSNIAIIFRYYIRMERVCRAGQ